MVPKGTNFRNVLVTYTLVCKISSTVLQYMTAAEETRTHHEINLHLTLAERQAEPAAAQAGRVVPLAVDAVRA